MQVEKNKVLIQMRDLRIGNGIAACIMNYYRYTVTHGYSVDFLLNRNIDSPYTETLSRYDSKVYVLPHDTGKPNRRNRAYINQTINLGYDIFHVNISGLNALEGLNAAKKAGIQTRIYHAHNPKETSSLKARLRSLIYESPCACLSNVCAACSHHAGDSVFGAREYTVIPNAMDTSNFCFDEEVRIRYRNELSIEDQFIVGVVGRFVEQKNPNFLIDIFAALVKIKPNAILLWVGEGDLRESVEQYIDQKGLQASVRLLGNRKDENKLYSAMDAFLLPSKFEGLGLVFIEAQISGLQCYGSDRVPRDVEISDRMHRIGLREPPEKWASAIERNSTLVRMDGREDAVAAGFEISEVAEALVSLYETRKVL